MVQNFIGGSEWRNTLIQGNKFNSPNILTSYAGITIGNTGPDSGDNYHPGAKYDGVVIKKNFFTNCGVSFAKMAEESDYNWIKVKDTMVTITDNDFDYTITTAGVIRGLISNGIKNARVRDTWFIGNRINLDYQIANSTFGIVGPRWAGPNYYGLHVEDNIIKMTGNTR